MARVNCYLLVLLLIFIGCNPINDKRNDLFKYNHEYEFGDSVQFEKLDEQIVVKNVHYTKFRLISLGNDTLSGFWGMDNDVIKYIPLSFTKNNDSCYKPIAMFFLNFKKQQKLWTSISYCDDKGLNKNYGLGIELVHKYSDNDDVIYVFKHTCSESFSEDFDFYSKTEIELIELYNMLSVFYHVSLKYGIIKYYGGIKNFDLNNKCCPY